MPELPDVEVIKQTFDNTAINKRIDAVEIGSEKVIQGLSAKALKSHLTGRRFIGSVRRGKYLLARLDTNEALVFHFGMTGYLHKQDGKPDKYSKITFVFHDHQRLEYVSKRMLGKLGIYESVEAFIEGKHLGPDAMNCTEEEFISHLVSSSGTIKSVLLDQEKVAGLGNIYTDEVLYQAHVHPESSVKSLNEKQLKSLHRRMHRVIDVAIRHHARPIEMPSGYLLTHRKKGDSCPRCGGKIEKITVSGRSTYLCGACQKK